eukprot:gene48472-62460_t
MREFRVSFAVALMMDTVSERTRVRENLEDPAFACAYHP